MGRRRLAALQSERVGPAEPWRCLDSAPGEPEVIGRKRTREGGSTVGPTINWPAITPPKRGHASDRDDHCRRLPSEPVPERPGRWMICRDSVAGRGWQVRRRRCAVHGEEAHRGAARYPGSDRWSSRLFSFGFWRIKMGLFSTRYIPTPNTTTVITAFGCESCRRGWANRETSRSGALSNQVARPGKEFRRMYAIIEDGSHQFRVREGDRIQDRSPRRQAGRRARLFQGPADHGRRRYPDDRCPRCGRSPSGRQNRQSVQSQENHHPEVPPAQERAPTQWPSPALHHGPDHQSGSAPIACLRLPVKIVQFAQTVLLRRFIGQRNGFFIFSLLGRFQPGDGWYHMRVSEDD